MDEVFFFIEDIADFSGEITIRAGADDVDPYDDGWFDRQIADPLFLMNSQPLDEFWHSINYISNYSVIYIVTNFDVDISERWLAEWEIPFDHVIEESVYVRMLDDQGDLSE